jgi:hypothetical protein
MLYHLPPLMQKPTVDLVEVVVDLEDLPMTQIIIHDTVLEGVVLVSLSSHILPNK